MEMYPSNYLQVSSYNEEHRKLREERSVTKRNLSTGPNFSNLYIEKIPHSFTEKNLMYIFSNYGTIDSLKIKKPQSNVTFRNLNFLPCSAYVNFETHEQAK